jgi:hypothetical protein
MEYIALMIGGFLIYQYMKPNKKATFTELAKIVKTMTFIEVEKIENSHGVIYLGYDIYTKQFLGQAPTCIELYHYIFQNKDKIDVIWAKLETDTDILIKIEKKLVTETIAKFN